jgi:hypothetical protein
MLKHFLGIVLIITGCASNNITETYLFIAQEFSDCVASASPKNSLGCYKQRVERFQAMPEHDGRWIVLTHASKSYLTRKNFVAGELTEAQAVAEESRWTSELKTNIDISNASSQRRNYELSRALSDFSKSTANPPSVNCRTNPDGVGGYRTVCQ